MSPGRPVDRSEPQPADVSAPSLHRLSVYLRCLRHLESLGERTISSHELARRYHLSSAQIRKDLAQFGEFGTRGVGYEIGSLAAKLHALLGLDREHRLVVVGAGNLGRALARFLNDAEGSFRVTAVLDSDAAKVGRRIGPLIVQPAREMERLVRETGAEIGVLAVPAEAAQANYEALIGAGVRAVLNFAPVSLELDPRVATRNVDLRVQLEELAYQLRDPPRA